MRFLLLLAAGAALLFAQSVSMFNGKTLAGWRDVGKLNVPGNSWAIDDGAIKSLPKPWIQEDLFSLGEYEDFEFDFEWKIAPGSNSGIKYRMQEAVFMNESLKRPNIKKFEDTVKDEMLRKPSDRSKLKPGEKGQLYTVAFEFQLIDEAGNKAGASPEHSTGALYSFLPPTAKAAKAPGQWNTGKIVAKGDHIEHWINGVKVLDASLKSPAIAAGAEKRWGKDHPVYKLLVEQPRKKSPILLQNHNDPAWFRNLRIKKL
jgi:hypothetical protein